MLKWLFPLYLQLKALFKIFISLNFTISNMWPQHIFLKAPKEKNKSSGH